MMLTKDSLMAELPLKTLLISKLFSPAISATSKAGLSPEIDSNAKDESKSEITGLREYNEQECADLFLRHAPPVRCVGTQWYCYECGTWKPTERDRFRKLTQQTMNASIRTAQRESNILKLVEGASQFDDSQFNGVYRMDCEDVLINCRNGVVRVNQQGYQMEAHSPDHNFTQSMAVEFEEGAKYDLFEKTLNEVIPDPKDRILLQVAAGNFLFPSCKHEVCLCSYGPGGTGKSTIADAIASIFEAGSGSVTTLSLQHLCEPKSYALPMLGRAALNIGTELDSLEIEESSNWKALVSGEPILARPIYGKPFKLRTAAKLWFLSNHMPRFKHGSDAEFRRMRFISFGKKPVSKDTSLKDKLRQEAPGIFIWMVEGLAELLRVNAVPYGGKETARPCETFSVQNDPLGSFVRKHCILGPSHQIGKENLRNEYKEFLEEEGLPADKLTFSFIKRLKERIRLANRIGGRVKSLTTPRTMSVRWRRRWRFDKPGRRVSALRFGWLGGQPSAAGPNPDNGELLNRLCPLTKPVLVRPSLRASMLNPSITIGEGIFNLQGLGTKRAIYGQRFRRVFRFAENLGK
jgi:P4 family phage/plasmid primase-like protien